MSPRQFLTRVSRANYYSGRSNAHALFQRSYHITSSVQQSRSAARSYLDSWIGLPHPAQASPTTSTPQNDSDNPVLKARAAMAQGPLLLSGSSYLLPTLRLENNESPESLKTRLEQASGNMDIDINIGSQSVSCPIVLDASALAPTGSPHYVPPEPGSILRIISLLEQFGMKVMGITAGSRQLSSQLTDEASQAGIPSVWSPRKAGSDPKFDVGQVLQLVERKQEEQQQQHQQPTTTNGITTSSGQPPKDASLVTQEILEEKSDEPQLYSAETEAATIIKDVKASEPTNKEEISPSPNDEPLPTPFEFSSTSTVYHGSVRSGQQIMSTKGQSLVILGSVNSGGEVLSDGDIFVFGKLRGRAFAGLGAKNKMEEQLENDESSSKTARIVATSFDAELVAIGDTFTTIDRVEDLNFKVPLKPGSPVMVTMEEPIEDAVAQTLKFVPVHL